MNVFSYRTPKYTENSTIEKRTIFSWPRNSLLCWNHRLITEYTETS